MWNAEKAVLTKLGEGYLQKWRPLIMALPALSVESRRNLLFLSNPRLHARAIIDLATTLEIHRMRRSQQLALAHRSGHHFRKSFGLEYTEWHSKIWVRVSTMNRFPLAQLGDDHEETLREVSAVAKGGGDATRYFSQGEKKSPGWTAEHSKKRLIATRLLLRSEPQDFRICVKIDSDRTLKIIDGGHRVCVARLMGEKSIKVWLTTGQIFSRQTTQFPLIFGNPVLAIERPPDQKG